MSSASSIIRWEWGGRPLCAYGADGSLQERRDALSLFPRPSLKRRILYAGMRLAATIGMDRFVAKVSGAPDPLLSGDECSGLVDRLWRMYEQAPIQWLITWPAMSSRRRLYLAYRVPSRAVTGVVKIGAGAFNARQLGNEAMVLERLKEGSHPFALPSVRFVEEWSNQRTIVVMDGFPVVHRPCSRPEANAVAKRIVDHLRSIPVPQVRPRVADTSWYSPGSVSAGMEDDGYEAVFAHGDLGPGNMECLPDGRVLLYDWENAAFDAPRETDRVGFWLALRQRDILRAPARALDLLREEMTSCASRDIRLALCFLAVHDHLAAQRLLEVWA